MMGVQDRCLLLALHQRRVGRAACVPPELLQLLYYTFVDPEGSLVSLCAAGRLDTLRHWHAARGIDVPRSCVLGGWRTAWEKHNLPVAQWLHATFALTLPDVLADNMWALRYACERGALAMAQWLYTTFCPPHSKAFAMGWPQSAKMFGRVCLGGHLDVARWLHATLGIDQAHVNYDNGFAFYIACLHDHAHVAHWLHDTFDLNASHAAVVVGVYYAWNQLYARGNMALLQWLDKVFPFGLWSGRRHVVAALFMACRHGHLQLAQWLHDKYRYTSSEVHTNYTLLGACVGNHLEVAQWLHRTFHVDKTQRRAILERDNNCPVVAQWLHATLSEPE